MSAYPNALVVAASQKGKTFLVNEAFHKPAGCFSVVFNTKRQPPPPAGQGFDGPRATTLAQVGESWRRYRTHTASSQRRWYGHPVFWPSRDPKVANHQLEVLTHNVLETAEEHGWGGQSVQVQVIVDEAHVFDGDALDGFTRTCLGNSVRTVLIDQDLTGLRKNTRNNCDQWVLLEPGRSDLNVLRAQFGYLYEPVLAWTSRRWHYVEVLAGDIRCWEPWPSQTWHPPGAIGGAAPAPGAVA